MSFAEGKEFVIKDVFTDVKRMKDEKDYSGEKVTHFRIPWEMNIYKVKDDLRIYLKCLKSSDNWSIDAAVKAKLINRDGKKSILDIYFFESNFPEGHIDSVDFTKVGKHMIDDKLTVEVHVKIIKVTATFKKQIRNFDDESAIKFADVVLIVENAKFHVCKMYLAAHSSYFESLFMGNFDESKKSEITLNNIDPYDFQNFLKVLYGEPAVNEDTVDGILELADMYDSQTAMRRCEEFLVINSEQSLKNKFKMAIKYKMDELKKKCMAEMTTKEDILSVLPPDVYQLDQSLWAELLRKAVSFE